MPVTADIKVGKRTVLTLSAGPGSAGRHRRRCASRDAQPKRSDCGRAGWPRPERMALLDRLLARISPPPRCGGRSADRTGQRQAGLPAAGAGRARRHRRGRVPRSAAAISKATGVPPSRAEGVRWLERAATQGYVEAQALLATLCLHGLASTASADGGAAAARKPVRRQRSRGCRISTAAIKWARKAAEGGSADGQAVLGYILTSGPEQLRDLDEAHRLVRALGRRRLPAGRTRLCAVAGTHRHQRGTARAGSRAICGAPPSRVCRPRSTCSA